MDYSSHILYIHYILTYIIKSYHQIVLELGVLVFKLEVLLFLSTWTKNHLDGIFPLSQFIISHLNKKQFSFFNKMIIIPFIVIFVLSLECPVEYYRGEFKENGKITKIGQNCKVHNLALILSIEDKNWKLVFFSSRIRIARDWVIVSRNIIVNIF